MDMSFRHLGGAFRRRKRFIAAIAIAGNAAIWSFAMLGGAPPVQASAPTAIQQTHLNGQAGVAADTYVLFGYNDLGMHCMNEDFSEMMILPPFNTFHGQLIRRAEDHPQIITSGAAISFEIPGNTVSSTKTNFWEYYPKLFGGYLVPNVGLTGTRMKGVLKPNPPSDWKAVGIPITPIMDDGTLNAYALATLRAFVNGTMVATTQNVIPVSWEISCNICHSGGGNSVAHNILASHDRLHGTNLVNEKPVVCAKCHADPALGLPGQPNVPSMSSAMHLAHADRFGGYQYPNKCYACHPGNETQCQRDNHLAMGINCENCHGDMAAVGNPNRRPWVDEPKCSNCHNVPGHDYEEPGKLFRESRGHGNVKCVSCHGSPHATTPTVTEEDNLQAIRLQGYPGPISKCTVCHTRTPDEAFFHSRDD